MTNIIDNGQSDDAITRLDTEDNQQTSQQECVTELATLVPITIQENLPFYRTFVTAPVSTHFPELS